uniref:Uncharacterized protein n=1 Tax=Setaria italica TaxID=4555 RepID=K3Z150_SETIT
MGVYHSLLFIQICHLAKWILQQHISSYMLAC